MTRTGHTEPDFEALLAECIRRFGEEGAPGVEQVCAAHPELAERLRARLASLQHLGLLGEEREAVRPETIGRYEIVRRLGVGGMAAVYLARDPEREREVALKVASTPLVAGDRSLVRFQREIRAFEQLRHPNVVPIFDSGEEQERPYFTMEYVPGATLGDVVEHLRREGTDPTTLTGRDVGSIVARHAASPDAVEDLDADEPKLADTWHRSYFETVARITLDVAAALEHLHANDVLHRDVKPSNILLRVDGQALLFDLGLAHVADQPALTRSGDFAGTPYYVSPEQLANGPKRLDARTDVYSLGVTLFELLTLTRPFEGRTTAEVLRRIQLEEPMPPRKLNPLVPRGLEVICLTALEKNPARRYASATELADDLRRFLAYEPVHARPVGAVVRASRFVRRKPAAAAAIGLSALVAVGLPIGLVVANAAIRDQRDLAAASAVEAQRQAERNARQTDFLVELFQLTGITTDPENPLSPRDILDRSVERIEMQFAGEPLVRAALMEATGRVYAHLGHYDRAQFQLDRAFALLHAELGEDHIDVARSLHMLASVHLEAGDAESAHALGQRSLAVFERVEAADDPEAVATRVTVADALARLGRSGDARGVLLEALASDPTPDIRERLGRIAREQGELDEARGLYEQAILEREESASPDPLAIARTYEALAEVHLLGKNLEAAREASERAVAIRTAWSSGPAVYTPSTLEETLDRFHLLPPWAGDFEEAFQDAITSLQGRKYRESILFFLRCLDLNPRSSACTYNIACCYALIGEHDQAMDWLERSAELGLATHDFRWNDFSKDRQLNAIRDHPRYEPLVERMRATRARAADHTSEPAVHLPASLPTGGPWPLLVVLHPSGGTKDDVISGPWVDVADELGMALLAPSAPAAVGEDPAGGMAWFEDVRDLSRKPWEHERRVVEQVRVFFEEHPIDRRRVIVAGEGTSTLLAFDLALGAPGLFRGAVLEDGTILPQIDPERTRSAAAMGARFRVRLGADLPGQPAPDELASHRILVEEWLAERGLNAVVQLGAEDALSEAVRSVLAP